MTREEFKRHMKSSVHTPSHSTSQTRGKDKKAESAEIERLTQEFLAGGGDVERLPSEQRRPLKSPAFNPSDIGGGE